jgi:hypothetical protein
MPILKIKYLDRNRGWHNNGQGFRVQSQGRRAEGTGIEAVKLERCEKARKVVRHYELALRKGECGTRNIKDNQKGASKNLLYNYLSAGIHCLFQPTEGLDRAFLS